MIASPLYGATRAAQQTCRSAHDTELVGLSISLYELILEKKLLRYSAFVYLQIALGRYLKAMEKTASSLSAAKETKEQEETVKAIRTSSASVIDVSHHLRNISQFDKSLGLYSVVFFHTLHTSAKPFPRTSLLLVADG
jgi:hypothetical protein